MNQTLLGNLLAMAPSAALYWIACATPAVIFWNSNRQALDSYSGGQALLLGPLTVLAGQLGWLANPLLFAGAVALLLGRYRSAALLALLALPLAAHALALASHPLPANEGGVGELTLRAWGPGFYLWLASMLTLAGGALGRYFLAAKS